DSNELACILLDAGFENISAINASHITTRRVRLNFVAIADITYIPQNIYDAIPYMTVSKMKEYNGLRVVHPDFQRMDMHRAFCIPYANPPLEVIWYRLKKDQKRFRLLDAQYPILSTNQMSEKYSVQKFALMTSDLNLGSHIEVAKDFLGNTAIS